MDSQDDVTLAVSDKNESQRVKSLKLIDDHELAEIERETDNAAPNTAATITKPNLPKPPLPRAPRYDEKTETTGS